MNQLEENKTRFFSVSSPEKSLSQGRTVDSGECHRMGTCPFNDFHLRWSNTGDYYRGHPNLDTKAKKNKLNNYSFQFVSQRRSKVHPGEQIVPVLAGIEA